MVAPGVGGTKRQSRRSRRSAEPDEEVEARLPCCRIAYNQYENIILRYFTGRTLITLAPAPAATIAAVVLTLKVLCPSPPVPTISTMKSSSPRSTAAGTALALNKLAAVANDSGLLSRRDMWSAARNAPICTGSTAPGVKMCSRASWRSCGLKYSGVLTSLFNNGLKVAWVKDFGSF